MKQLSGLNQYHCFAPSDVQLLDGPIRNCRDRNSQYLLSLEPQRLLHHFRTQAGISSNAVPLEGWEAPTCGLRGHFVGHYLSACAIGWADTQDQRLKERVQCMLDGLAECQQALGTGYLSAFPESDLDAIETRFDGAWASYYVLHKLLAGLLDVHRYCHSRAALEMACRLADYIKRRIERLTPPQIEGMCRTDNRPNPTNEFGGMSEVLQNLADAASNPDYDALARVFEPDWFLQPLIHQEDRLSGLHSNTHIPVALGLARRYERTGELTLRDAVSYFWERTALMRSYVNGGSSGPRPDGTEKSTGGEHWPHPNQLAGTLTPKINESCVTHNMLRLTDALFRWTGDGQYAAFYERAYFNSVLAMPHPDQPGRYIYGHPLGAMSRKEYGTPTGSFWCCYGTSVEAFAHLSGGIYYHGRENEVDTLVVNLLVPSEVSCGDMRLLQRSRFPEETTARFEISVNTPTEAGLKIRLPAGVATATSMRLNAQSIEAQVIDGYLYLRRTWNDGDCIELGLSPQLTIQSMPDDANRVAFLHGPLVLAAQTDCPLSLAANSPLEALDQIKPTGNGFKVRLNDGTHVPLLPLNRIGEEAFGVYFTLSAGK